MQAKSKGHCSLQAFTGLHVTHPHYGGSPVLLKVCRSRRLSHPETPHTLQDNAQNGPSHPPVPLSCEADSFHGISRLNTTCMIFLQYLCIISLISSLKQFNCAL